jgi:hypothetical protein
MTEAIVPDCSDRTDAGIMKSENWYRRRKYRICRRALGSPLIVVLRGKRCPPRSMSRAIYDLDDITVRLLQGTVQNMAESMLKQLGYEVLVASGGAEAEKLLSENRDQIRCVITVSMFGMDGWDTLAVLAKNPAAPPGDPGPRVR